jgi:oligopeptide transport system ATP-binding protein
LVCDEPVSSLDVSVQGQIVNLFADIRARDGTAILFISHDLALVRHLAHRAMVMYLGRVIEEAGTQSLFKSPKHPYTQALIAAVAHWNDGERPAQKLLGDPPSALLPPSGCAYRTRCPFATGRCAAEMPELEETDEGHRVACHHWRELA